MGSVKNIIILERPTDTEMGVGYFDFTDRYSIFDYGEMPDHPHNFGSARCLISAAIFEELIRNKIPTHYIGLVCENLEGKEHICSTKEIDEPTNKMLIDIVNVIEPTYDPVKGLYDYSRYNTGLKNILVPGEWIYRRTLPKGSSVFGRLEDGTLTPEAIGLHHHPIPGEILKKPIVEVSTKLESIDRYIGWDEAIKIMGLKKDELNNIKKLTRKVGGVVPNYLYKKRLSNDDGKIEVLLDSKRRTVVCDAISPDEIRVNYKGNQFSKEVFRQPYRGSAFEADVKRAKKEAARLGVENWKSRCTIMPDRVEPELVTIASDMYCSLANKLINRKIYDCPSINEVNNHYIEWLQTRAAIA